jgi:cell fate (sporulation/competence/biofilm development) regulator YlbF (YheA/YmcA/DUF963 family)
MSQCSLAAHPPVGLADDRLIEAMRHLVDALVDLPEYQMYLNAAYELNQDPQASQLSQLIREQRHSFTLGTLSELQSQLNELPVMVNFLAAQQALCCLFTQVNGVISTAAGINFKEHVRTREHG